MINWPCLFKLEGDDELLLVKSQAALYSECESLIFSERDILIDSTGQGYSVSFNSTEASTSTNTKSKAKAKAKAESKTDLAPNKAIQSLEAIKVNRQYTLDEITHLIQAHEFANANVCLSKIQFLSIESAISALSNDNQ